MKENEFTAVCFGEVLFDILPDKKLPGGAPMNVAYHLNQMGIPTAMVSSIGDDELGNELLDYFTSKKVSGKFIQKDYEHDTSRVLAKVEGNQVTYDIIKPVAWDFIKYNKAIENLVSKARYFIFGSLGARSEVSKRTLFELLEIAPFKILDINLRPPHYENTTLEYLLQHADMLKLNDQELEILSGWYGFSGNEKEQMESLKDKFHFNTVITTRGDKGAAVLHEGGWYEHPGFKVQVADTIGSGDAFLAGYISRFMQQMHTAEILEFACKMGAFMASRPGACPSYTMAEVEEVSADAKE